MAETERLAQTLIDMIPRRTATGRPDDSGTIARVGMVTNPATGAVTGVSSVAVMFPAGLMACRWTDAFEAAVRADPAGFGRGGQRVLCEIVGATPIVTGTIHSEGVVDDGL